MWMSTRLMHQVCNIGNFRCVLSNITCIILLIVAYAFLSRVVARPFYITSPGMEPNIDTGDVILSSVLQYKFDVPKPGDIAMFHKSDGKVWVARVIGVPNDVVSLSDGLISVNGSQLSQFKFSPWKSKDGHIHSQFVEVNLDGVSYRVLREPGGNPVKTSLIAGDDEYIVVSDSRNVPGRFAKVKIDDFISCFAVKIYPAGVLSYKKSIY